MLRTAIIIERAQVGLGGAERSVSELTSELRRQGVEATILAARGDTSAQVRVLCGSGGKRTSLKRFEAAVQSHLKENPYDIVHSTLPIAGADIYQPRGGSYRETMLRNAASYAGRFQRFVKLSTHALNLRRLEYQRAEERLCAGSQTVVAALSRYVCDQFKRHYGLPDERICVIGNGVSTEFDPALLTDGRQRQMLCELTRTDPQKPSVFFLFAANNPRLKGLRPLLHAMRKAVDQSKAVRPVLIVAGSKGFGPYGGLVKELGLGGHVHSVNAVDGIWPLLAACDAAVLPSYYDPCSRFILEALAMGRPVITTRYNGAAERFVHLRHGIVVDEPDDVLRLGGALTHYCDLPEIELAAQAIAEDNLREAVSIRKHAKKLIELYETIRSGKKR